MNIKELADIGAKAARIKLDQSCTAPLLYVSAGDTKDEPARQAFAIAIKDAVEKPLLERIKELESKPTPPVVDGKTPGEVLLGSLNPYTEFRCASDNTKAKCEAAASAVLAAFGQAQDADELEQRTIEQAAKIQELFARAEKAEAERGICEDNAFKMQAQITELINQRNQLLAVLATKLDSLPTFQAHGKTWTRHTPGDPMPCDAKALVDCICDNNITLGACSADTWHWSGTIIGWRYADEPTPTVTVPLDASDIRATDEFRPCGEVFQICPLRYACEEFITLQTSSGWSDMTYQTLAENYLRRQHGSNEWKPCTKEAK